MAKKWLPQSRWPYDLVLLVLFCGVTESCPPRERRLLMTCLEPLHHLQENPNYPSQKACNIIVNLIDCVEQRLFRCHGVAEVHDALSIAESLKAEYCNVEDSEKRSTTTVATTITTVIPRTTFTTRPSSVRANETKLQEGADEGDSEIDHKFQLCRDKFTKHDPKVLEEGCRLAEAFLDCGYAVLQAYKVSLDTLYLHAELLRNSAIYWEYCGDERSSVPAVRNAKKERCQAHVIQHLKDCLVVTKHMVKGNEKPFCSLVTSYIPCIAPLVNKCSHVRQFDRVEDFLMDSLDLQRLHCLSPLPIFSEAETGTTPLPEPSDSAKKGHGQSGEDPLHASGLSKKENSVPLNKQHALSQLKNPSKEATAGVSSTPDFRKSGSRRKYAAPKVSSSELPESRDSDGDDVTRTGSGGEETGPEGLTKMQEELSSGEGKISSSEQHEGTERDGSLLEDDPSGSGASWQQEVKVDSSTTVYGTPRQPEDLPKTPKTTKLEKHTFTSVSFKLETPEEINKEAEKLASGYSDLETNKTTIRNKKNKENLFPKKGKKTSSTTILSANTRIISDNQENKTVVGYEAQSKENVGIDAKGKQPLDEEKYGKTYAEVSLLSPSSTTIRSNNEDKYMPETTSQSLSNNTPYYTKEDSEDQDETINHYRGEENEDNVYPTETESPLKKTKSQKKSSRKSDQSSEASYKPSTNGIQKKSEVTETPLSINNHVNEPAKEKEAEEETDGTSYYYENVEEEEEAREEDETNLFPDELGEWSTLQPWGSGCSTPFYGSQFCTAIMMTTQLGNHESECRSLRSYVSCLRALMVACDSFPSFETIPGTIRHILIHYRQKCME